MARIYQEGFETPLWDGEFNMNYTNYGKLKENKTPMLYLGVTEIMEVYLGDISIENIT